MEILVENCLELGLLEGGQDLGGVEAGEGGEVEAGQPGNHGAGLVPRQQIELPCNANRKFKMVEHSNITVILHLY